MSFNRVADIYDRTRAMPEGVVDKLMQRIVEATGADRSTRFLELGIGTGRIALPFIRAGYTYTGVDIADDMVAQLRAKLQGEEQANVQLLHADVTDLPLADNSIDVALAVHVLHLVEEWKQALREARRVLTPDGYFVMASDRPTDNDPADEIRAQWRERVIRHGATLRGNNGTWDAADAELTAMGGRTAVYQVAAWTVEVRPRDLLEEQINRVFSLTWTVPDDVLQAVHKEMIAWATERYGSLDIVLESRVECQVSITRFDPSLA